MEQQMRKHDADWGDSWKSTTVPALLRSLDSARWALMGARLGNDWHKMTTEAADVANIAMFLAYNMGDLTATNKVHGVAPEDADAEA
jgi:hypothetical protein